MEYYGEETQERLLPDRRLQESHDLAGDEFPLPRRYWRRFVDHVCWRFLSFSCSVKSAQSVDKSLYPGYADACRFDAVLLVDVDQQTG